MPYKSKAQVRKFFAMEDRGEIAEGTAERWAHHTKSIKSLPEHVKKRKKAAALALARIGIKVADVGPYMGDIAATVKSQDELVGGLARNRDQRFGQYLLNPYVGGPLQELITRFGRRAQAGRAAHPALAYATAGGGLNPLNLIGYPAAAIMGGPEAREKARAMYDESNAPKYEGAEKEEDKAVSDARKKRHEKHAAGEGPFATERSSMVTGLDKQIGMMERNRHEHPGHYWANPFVYGPLSELFSRAYRRYNASQATIPAQAYMRGAATGIASLPTHPAIRGVGNLGELGMGITGAVTGDEGPKTKARETFESSGSKDYTDVAEDKEKVKKDKERRDKHAFVFDPVTLANLALNARK